MRGMRSGKPRKRNLIFEIFSQGLEHFEKDGDFLIAKMHQIDLRRILAACDKEHLGKTFESGKISFTVSEKFFGGAAVSSEELEKMLEEAGSANLFGNKCVAIAQKKGLISESGVILISGIKHAQLYQM